MKLRFITMLFICSVPAMLIAKSYLMPVQSAGEIVVSSDTIYDNGGAESNYSNNSQDTLILIPENGGYVTLNFFEFSFASAGDTLKVYNGNWDELIGAYTKNPRMIASTNPDGSLILVFSSDGDDTYEGFSAEVINVESLPGISYLFMGGLPTVSLVRETNTFYMFEFLNNSIFDLDKVEYSVYLSMDTLLDNHDIYLDGRTESIKIYADEFYGDGGEMSVPNTVELGDYYLLTDVHLESGGIYSDFDTVMYWPINLVEPKTDLYFDNLIVENRQLKPLGNYSVYVDAHNSGNVPSAVTTGGLYISKDLIVDDQDIMVSECGIDPLEPRTKIRRSFTIEGLNLGSYSSGSYYLLAKIDNNEIDNELREDNNTLISQIYYERPGDVTANIALTNLTIPDSIFSGELLYYDLEITTDFNITLSDAKIYISDDEVLDREIDYLLDEFPPVNLQIGTNSISRNTSTDLYPGLGEKFIFIEVNSNGLIVESTLEDNVVFDTVFISDIATYDSKPTHSTLSLDSLLPGQEIVVEYEIANLGNSVLPQTATGFVLSDDVNYDASDKLLKKDYLPKIYPGSNLSKAVTLTVENDQHGLYYLLVVSDYNVEVAEFNEENNVIAAPLRLIDPSAISGFDLEMISMEVSDTLYGGVSAYLNTEFILHSNEDKQFSFSGWVSDDDQIDGTELFDTDFGTDLNLPAYRDFSYRYRIPKQDVQESKDYYIIVKADRLNMISEDDESNNTLIKKVFFRDNSYAADLYVPSFNLYNKTLSKSETLKGTYCIKRNDYNADDSIFVKMFISPKYNTGAINELVYCDTMLTVKCDNDFKLDMPEGIEAGVYNLTLETFPESDKLETDTTNNTWTNEFVVLEGEVDLDLTKLDITNNVIYTEGDINTVSSIMNIGTAITSNCNIQYILSTDEEISEDDHFLKFVPIPDPGIQNQYNREERLSLNSLIPVGDYFLIVQLDPENDITESDETNNILTRQIHIEKRGYNYNFEQLDIDKFDYEPGENVEIKFIVKNDGNIPSERKKVNFYLSSDTLYDENDTYLFDYTIPAIGAGMSISREVLYIMDIELNPGYYNLVCVVPSTSNLELNKDDNEKYVPIHILPPDCDFEYVSHYLRDTMYFTPGSTTFHFTSFANTGLDKYSGSVKLGQFISKDTILDQATDTMTTYLMISADYEPEMIKTVDYGLMIPEAIEYGTYSFFLVLDPENEIEETDEDNNIHRITIHVIESDVDLTANDFTASTDTIKPDIDIKIYYDLINLGYTSSERYPVNALFISTDTILDEEDIRFELVNDQPIHGLANRSCEHVVSVPAYLFHGDCYIILELDHLQTISETDEENNTLHFPAYIKEPKLDLDLYPPTSVIHSAQQGEQIELNCKVFNNSVSITKSFNIAFILSEDHIFDSSDSILAVEYVSGIDPHNKYQANQIVNIPEVENGDYYIIFYADYDEQISETDETNNSKSMYIHIYDTETEFPDLTIDYFSLEKQTSKYEATIVLKNEGSVPAIEYAYGRIILSKDWTLDEEDNTALQFTIPGMNAWEIKARRDNLNINTEYYKYLFLEIDFTGIIQETNENNNLYRHVLTTPVNMLDLAIETDIETIAAFPGDQVVVGSVLKNVGGSDADSTLIQYFVSEDQIPGDEDMLISEKVAGYLQEEGEQKFTDTIDLPYELYAKNYYLIAAANMDSVWSEMEFKDNVALIDVNILPAASDLDLQADLSGITVQDDDTIRQAVTLTNTGKGVSGKVILEWFISIDEYFGDEDLHLVSDTLNRLFGTQSITDSIKRPVPGSLDHGSYYLLARAREEGESTEDSLVNNLVAIPCVITDIVRENTLFGDITIYPNPTSDHIRINSSKEIDQVRVLDMLGHVVKEIKGKEMQWTLDVSVLSPGSYTLLLRAGEEMIPVRFEVVR